MSKLAPGDSSTLLDRAQFLERLEAAIADGQAVTLGAIDLDDFQGINDRFGREGGDAVLAAFADQLRALAGPGSAFAGRMAGDEFALAFVGETLEGGFLRLERLRAESGEHLGGALPGKPAARPTISVGAANFPRDVKTAADLLKRADQALWQAKEGGRNQVALPSPEDMVLKSNYYTPAQLGRLKKLAEARHSKESLLLREALDDLLRKYDVAERSA